MIKSWEGESPECCDGCGKPILNIFIDGKTRFGLWAIMCLDCYNELGTGLGQGLGQQYWKDPDGRFSKVEG